MKPKCHRQPNLTFAVTLMLAYNTAYASEIPGKIEAENATYQNGTATEITADVGGGLNVGSIETGDYLSFTANVTYTGIYQLQMRVATPRTGTEIDVRVNGNSIDTVSVPNTGNWQNWTTLDIEIELESGIQTIDLVFSGTFNSGLMNINWIDTELLRSSAVVIQKKNTSFAIDGNNGAIEEQEIYLWSTNTNNINQQWNEISQGDGYYAYQKNTTTLCLDGGDGAAKRQPITLEQCDANEQNQHWLKVGLSNGTFRLEKRGTNYSIDGNHGAEQQQPIYLWNSSDTNVNQQWEFFTTADTPIPENISRTDAVRFLIQAAYGPTETDIEKVQSLSYEGWIAEQRSMTPVYWVDRIESIDAVETAYRWHLSGLFWEGVVDGDDQLRQRVAFALSQIIANNTTIDLNHARPEIFGYYWDLFQTYAFGNYEDLLYDISVSPSMGLFLTHLNNEKEDAEKGTAPDENYAREVMQLFTIGLVNLNASGESTGVESYTTEDVQQLARVFTGFSWDDGNFGGGSTGDHSAHHRAMAGFDNQHEFGDKHFLGKTISGTVNPEESVSQAISILVAHPNTAPFISKQFIQKLVTANPSPNYIKRVSTAFSTGLFVTPSGTTVGTGRHGDMAAMITAVLLDDEARDSSSATDPRFGKVRGPVLRQAQWARTFRDNDVRDLEGIPPTFRSDYTNNGMGQTPLRAQSVFSFYRPGYVLPDSQTASAGLVNPEMQIVTSSTTYGYLQYMSQLITGPNDKYHAIFTPDYSAGMALATNANLLADYLNEIMVYGTLTGEVYNRVINAIGTVSIAGLNGDALQEALRDRIEIAMMIIIAAPEYTTQR